MSDDAMTVAADAAPMADTPVAEPVTERQSPSNVPEKSNVSAREAIEKHFAFLDGDKPATPDEGGQRDRNPDGTFKAKATDAVTPQATADKALEKPVDPNAVDKPTNFVDAPSRFSPEAKAAWQTAPEPVRAEITRAIKELEGGIETYRQQFEPYKDFDKQLRANGQSFGEVLNHYTGIEKMLAEDPIKGLEQICQNMGGTLRQVAEYVLNKTPDQAAAAQEGIIAELRNEIAALKKQTSTIDNTFRTQQSQKVEQTVAEFAKDKPDFDALAGDVVFFIESGRANDLQTAYDLAKRLNTSQVTTAPAADAATQTANAAQTRDKGRLSVTGAPSSGSNPVNRKPPASARDALDRSFAAVGL